MTEPHRSPQGGPVFRRGGVGLTAIAAGVYVSAMPPEQIRTRRYTVRIRDLPPELDGLRIIHVSDTHYAPFVGRRLVARAAHIANAHRPDIICFTGDYVHRWSRAVEVGIAQLAQFESRYGGVAVLGNHDHWGGIERSREAFSQIGIPLIDNSGRYLTAEGFVQHAPFGSAICVAGVGDLWEDEALFERATAEAPPNMPRLVLAHNPDSAERVPAGLRVDLMLSGHTHGGQVSLPGIGAPVVPSRYGQRYVGGLCRGPHFPVIVSRGIGLAILPIRFRVPPEIGLIALRREV